MQEINLEITTKGGVRMLHDDALNLAEFGHITMERASHVEFYQGCQGWGVTSAKTGKRLKCCFRTRTAALAWEKQYYSPDGEGWSELVDA